MSAQHTATATHGHHEPSMTKKKIWFVFWVLFVITSIEFVIALAIPETIMPQVFKNVVYIGLTLLKAFYIVAYFMHLKFEKMGLALCILVPLVFIIGFIVAMLYEGNFWLMIR